jgi:hypothetical protein
MTVHQAAKLSSLCPQNGISIGSLSSALPNGILQVCITCQTCAGCHFGCGLRPALHHTRPTKPCSCILKALVTRLTWVDIRTFKEEREAVPRVYCTQTRPPIQCVLTETRPISARSPKQPITDYDQRPGSVRLSSFILKNELKSLQNMCETEVARQPCDQLP